MLKSKIYKFCICLFVLCFCFVPRVQANELLVGAATGDITPTQPVPLRGQLGLRISQGVKRPVTVNVLALETRDGDKSLETVIFVSCDLVSIHSLLDQSVREKLKTQLPELDVAKVILSATHTHTAPQVGTNPAFLKKILDKNVLSDTELLDFTANRITDTIVKAWNSRTGHAQFTWGSDSADIAQCRREVYADGHAVMYGSTAQDDFDHFEAIEDHSVGVLFFFNAKRKMVAIAVNVACPSQVNEFDTWIDADYWHFVRERLHKRFGQDVVILGWCSAAGDVSPHIQYQQAMHARMRALHGFPEGPEGEMMEIARKLDRAVASVWDAVQKEMPQIPDNSGSPNWLNAWNNSDSAPYSCPVLKHETGNYSILLRKVPEDDYNKAKQALNEILTSLENDTKNIPGHVMLALTYQNLIKLYEAQKQNPTITEEHSVHIVRLGDVGICTNEHELFTDYGIRIKSLSPAQQTFLIQLAGDDYYLTTQRAVEAGSYSVDLGSAPFDPTGGDKLVRISVELLRNLWK